MANHLVSGVLVPDSVSGHLALELANTRAGWGTAAPREYLVDYDALAVWAGDVGHLRPAEVRALRSESRRHPRRARAVLAAALTLREAWYAVATAPSTGSAPTRPDLDELGTALARATRVSRLVPTDDGRVVPDGGAVARAGLWLPVHRAALAAAGLLAEGGTADVGRCAGQGCGWLFHDPAHRRHWCVMAICGNRAKVRRFAERQRAAAGLP